MIFEDWLGGTWVRYLKFDSRAQPGPSGCSARSWPSPNSRSQPPTQIHHTTEWLRAPALHPVAWEWPPCRRLHWARCDGSCSLSVSAAAEGVSTATWEVLLEGGKLHATLPQFPCSAKTGKCEVQMCVGGIGSFGPFAQGIHKSFRNAFNPFMNGKQAFPSLWWDPLLQERESIRSADCRSKRKGSLSVSQPFFHFHNPNKLQMLPLYAGCVLRCTPSPPHGIAAMVPHPGWVHRRVKSAVLTHNSSSCPFVPCM